MFRRLRGRLDHLEGEASETMRLAQALLEDLQDGITLELELFGRTFPVSIRLDPREHAEAGRGGHKSGDS